MKKNNLNYQYVKQWFNQPMFDLLSTAHEIHRKNFALFELELCTLLSIKTGACPENCAYCPQSSHYKTGVYKEPLMKLDDIITKAKEAKTQGATRFCMGGAWRSPPLKHMPAIAEMIQAVKRLGLETCMTLGLLDIEKVTLLKKAGLDYYNHNLDTSPHYYKKIITTRMFQDRLNTLKLITEFDIKLCCGGILGMGETRNDRIELLLILANLPKPPISVPLNRLIPIQGTPLEKIKKINDLEFIRTIAVTRILLPTSMIRLAAGRDSMSDTMQTLCFFAGANSIFYGEKLFTAKNHAQDKDRRLIRQLGLKLKINHEPTNVPFSSR